jgi:hypothetical protein
MEIRFYRDIDSGLAHCYSGHGIREQEVIEVLRRPARRFRGRDGTLSAEGQTEAGRYLRVIYREYRQQNYIFVITAYDLGPKGKRALRRRK